MKSVTQQVGGGTLGKARVFVEGKGVDPGHRAIGSSPSPASAAPRPLPCPGL